MARRGRPGGDGGSPKPANVGRGDVLSSGGDYGLGRARRWQGRQDGGARGGFRPGAHVRRRGPAFGGFTLRARDLGKLTNALARGDFGQAFVETFQHPAVRQFVDRIGHTGVQPFNALIKNLDTAGEAVGRPLSPGLAFDLARHGVPFEGHNIQRVLGRRGVFDAWPVSGWKLPPAARGDVGSGGGYGKEKLADVVPGAQREIQRSIFTATAKTVVSGEQRAHQVGMRYRALRALGDTLDLGLSDTGLRTLLSAPHLRDAADIQRYLRRLFLPGEQELARQFGLAGAKGRGIGAARQLRVRGRALRERREQLDKQYPVDGSVRTLARRYGPLLDQYRNLRTSINIRLKQQLYQQAPHFGLDPPKGMKDRLLDPNFDASDQKMLRQFRAAKRDFDDDNWLSAFFKQHSLSWRQIKGNFTRAFDFVGPIPVPEKKGGIFTKVIQTPIQAGGAAFVNQTSPFMGSFTAGLSVLAAVSEELRETPPYGMPTKGPSFKSRLLKRRPYPMLNALGLSDAQLKGLPPEFVLGAEMLAELLVPAKGAGFVRRTAFAARGGEATALRRAVVKRSVAIEKLLKKPGVDPLTIANILRGPEAEAVASRIITAHRKAVRHQAPFSRKRIAREIWRSYEKGRGVLADIPREVPRVSSRRRGLFPRGVPFHQGEELSYYPLLNPLTGALRTTVRPDEVVPPQFVNKLRTALRVRLREKQDNGLLQFLRFIDREFAKGRPSIPITAEAPVSTRYFERVALHAYGHAKGAQKVTSYAKSSQRAQIRMMEEVYEELREQRGESFLSTVAAGTFEKKERFMTHPESGEAVGYVNLLSPKAIEKEKGAIEEQHQIIGDALQLLTRADPIAIRQAAAKVKRFKEVMTASLLARMRGASEKAIQEAIVAGDVGRAQKLQRAAKKFARSRPPLKKALGSQKIMVRSLPEGLKKIVLREGKVIEEFEGYFTTKRGMTWAAGMKRLHRAKHDIKNPVGLLGRIGEEGTAAMPLERTLREMLEGTWRQTGAIRELDQLIDESLRNAQASSRGVSPGAIRRFVTGQKTTTSIPRATVKARLKQIDEALTKLGEIYNRAIDPLHVPLSPTQLKHTVTFTGAFRGAKVTDWEIHLAAGRSVVVSGNNPILQGLRKAGSTTAFALQSVGTFTRALTTTVGGATYAGKYFLATGRLLVDYHPTLQGSGARMRVVWEALPKGIRLGRAGKRGIRLEVQSGREFEKIMAEARKRGFVDLVRKIEFQRYRTALSEEKWVADKEETIATLRAREGRAVLAVDDPVQAGQYFHRRFIQDPLFRYWVDDMADDTVIAYLSEPGGKGLAVRETTGMTPVELWSQTKGLFNDLNKDAPRLMGQLKMAARGETSARLTSAEAITDYIRRNKTSAELQELNVTGLYPLKRGGAADAIDKYYEATGSLLHVLHVGARFSRRLSFDRIFAESVRSLIAQGVSFERALDSALPIATVNTQRIMYDLINMTSFESRLRWAAFYLGKKRMHFSYIGKLISRRPQLALAWGSLDRYMEEQAKKHDLPEFLRDKIRISVGEREFYLDPKAELWLEVAFPTESWLYAEIANLAPLVPSLEAPPTMAGRLTGGRAPMFDLLGPTITLIRASFAGSFDEKKRLIEGNDAMKARVAVELAWARQIGEDISQEEAVDRAIGDLAKDTIFRYVNPLAITATWSGYDQRRNSLFKAREAYYREINPRKRRAMLTRNPHLTALLGIGRGTLEDFLERDAGAEYVRRRFAVEDRRIHRLTTTNGKFDPSKTARNLFEIMQARDRKYGPVRYDPKYGWVGYVAYATKKWGAYGESIDALGEVRWNRRVRVLSHDFGLDRHEVRRLMPNPRVQKELAGALQIIRHLQIKSDPEGLIDKPALRNAKRALADQFIFEDYYAPTREQRALQRFLRDAIIPQAERTGAQFDRLNRTPKANRPAIYERIRQLMSEPLRFRGREWISYAEWIYFSKAPDEKRAYRRRLYMFNPAWYTPLDWRIVGQHVKGVGKPDKKSIAAWRKYNALNVKVLADHAYDRNPDWDSLGRLAGQLARSSGVFRRQFEFAGVSTARRLRHFVQRVPGDFDIQRDRVRYGWRALLTQADRWAAYHAKGFDRFEGPERNRSISTLDRWLNTSARETSPAFFHSFNSFQGEQSRRGSDTFWNQIVFQPIYNTGAPKPRLNGY